MRTDRNCADHTTRMDKLPFLIEILNPLLLQVDESVIPWCEYEARYKEYTGKYALMAQGPRKGKGPKTKKRKTES